MLTIYRYFKHLFSNFLHNAEISTFLYKNTKKKMICLLIYSIKSNYLCLLYNKIFVMENTRQQKIARLLQKELGEIFLLYAKSIQGTLISVTNIRISPDLSIAKVYLSIFPSEKSEAILQNIQDSVKSIRFELGNRVRNQLRVIPELSFFIDDTLDYLENIDNLLKK